MCMGAVCHVNSTIPLQVTDSQLQKNYSRKVGF